MSAEHVSPSGSLYACAVIMTDWVTSPPAVRCAYCGTKASNSLAARASIPREGRGMRRMLRQPMKIA